MQPSAFQLSVFRSPAFPIQTPANVALLQQINGMQFLFFLRFEKRTTLLGETSLWRAWVCDSRQRTSSIWETDLQVLGTPPSPAPAFKFNGTTGALVSPRKLNWRTTKRLT
jgi:hypothetical protein